MMVSTLVYVFALLSLGLARRDQGGEPDAGAANVDGLHSAERLLFRVSFSRAKRCRGFSTRSARSCPTTYFIALMRAIILRGATFFEYWSHLAIMTGMSIAFFCVCALRFRKKIG